MNMQVVFQDEYKADLECNKKHCLGVEAVDIKERLVK